jgi:hypothetical protein
MKARQIQSRAARAPMFGLSSIASAAAMALIATGAHAAGTTVDTAFVGAVSNATAGLPDRQSNSGNVDATITNATIGTTATGTSTSPTPTPVSLSTNGNLIGASATGNIASSTVGTLASPVGALDNAATVAIGINSGTVSSKVDNSKMESISLQTGSVLNADNTISATTTINSGTSLVSGTASSAPAQQGSATLLFPAGPTLFNASGNIVVTSVQSAAGATSTALAKDSMVDLLMVSTVNSAVTGTASLDRNTVSAVLKGNSANSTAQIQSGGAPTFAGSAMVANLQVNGNGIVAAAHSATNTGATVLGAVAGIPGATNTLKGTLSVQGNAISSAVTGNDALGATGEAAGNRIVLGDAVSVAGTTAPTANDSTHTGVGVATNVKSDLAVINSQGNLGSGLASTMVAQTAGASVVASAQAVEGGTVLLRDNSITAAMTGNAASSSIATGKDAASYSASTALSNQQSNSGAPGVALMSPSAILAQAGDATHGVVNGTVSVGGNRVAATAQGNQATQSVALAASDLNIGSGAAVLTGGTSSDGRVSAAGSTTITNLQGNYNDGGVGATNGAPFVPGSLIWLTANGGGAPVSNSALSSTTNRQEAIAVGNGATNALSLTGTTVGTGAGIASVQMNDASSGVGAGLYGAQAAILVAGDIDGKASVALTDNVQRAIGYGNSASNAVGVKAGGVTVTPSAAVASSVAVDLAGSLPFDNTLATQPVVNAAYGVFNDQSTRSTVNSAATGSDGFAVAVVGSVTGSSVANDRNAFVAAAYGNDAANGVALDVGNLQASGFASVANVTNAQAVGGGGTNIGATAAGGTVDRTVISGGLDTASVSASNNNAQALAYGSRATSNTVSVKGTNIDTSGTVDSGATLAANVLAVNASFGVQNAQAGQGRVAAERSGGPEVWTQVGGAVSASSVTANGNTAGADATSNSAVNGVAIDAANVATTSAVQNAQFTSADVSSRVGQSGGPLGSQAGVRVSLGGASVQGSKVVVSKNEIGGSSTGNAATSSIDVKGANISSANGQLLASVGSQVGATNANADHALSNTQLVLGTPRISSSVGGVFGIDAAVGSAVTGSTLSVTGNKQSAEATGNTATNSVTLAGAGGAAAANVSARTALQSTQANFGAVDAKSGMQAFAPASVSGSSTVDISGNANSAAAVSNDATNIVSVKADNSAGVILPAIVTQGALPGNTAAAGDQLLLNRQSASGAVASTATTEIYNQDRAAAGTALAGGSSFKVTGNSTVSQATANQATNANALAGGADQAARLAVLNVQDSSGTSKATADSTMRLTLNGGTPLNGGGGALDGNITSGIATGNAATNSLDVKGGVVSGNLLLPGAGTLTVPTASTLVVADQALVNVQVQTGAVSSKVTGSIGIDTTTGATIGGSTLSVSDNKQAATAVANTALNSVSLAGTSVEARSATQSVQTGDAPVSASSTMTLFAPAGSTSSTVRLSGNSNTALGVINDATNTLKVAGGNTQPQSSAGAVLLGEAAASGVVLAAGDHVVSNRQAATTAVSATATTALDNDDNTPGAASLANGSLAVTGNSTFAEASANRANNSATVAAGAVQGASVGIVNSQSSTADATAKASTVVSVSLTSAAGATALNSSGISLDGNTTAALARGNAATNVLESSAGSGYGAAATAPGSGSLSASPLALNVTASAAILNSQTNAGAVSASSSGTTYQVALNATGAPGTLGVSNGSVGVTGNTLAAQAYGNSATNRLTQTALNTGSPSAVVGNYQVNTGNVTASVTSVNFGASVSGPVSSGSLRTAGNQITASAVGNSASSSIASR